MILSDVELNLTQSQIERLKKMKMSGKGISMKLSKDQLKKSENSAASMTSMKLPKSQANKINKAIKNNKGLVLRIDNPSKIVMNGGAVSAGSAIMSLGMANEFLNDYPNVKAVLSSIGEDIKYLFENPLAISYRYIVSSKIPNLNKRYRDIDIDIERTKKDMSLIDQNKNPVIYRGKQREIFNLEALRDKVGSHITALIERLPSIREMAEERNETIKQRKAAALEKQIQNTENKLEALAQKATGNGLQVDGYGLQVDGNGVVIDKIKNRIKNNHIQPLIQKEKQKAKEQIQVEIEKAKKKAEEEARKKLEEAKKKAEQELKKKLPSGIDPSAVLGFGQGGKKKAKICHCQHSPTLT